MYIFIKYQLSNSLTVIITKIIIENDEARP